MTHVEIRFTVDDQADADTIVGVLLSEKLVACGQRIGPIISRYWWSGSIEQAEEWLVLLKTRSELTERVIDIIVEHHPYDTPEVVALPFIGGHAAYLDWLDDVTDRADDLNADTHDDGAGLPVGGTGTPVGAGASDTAASDTAASDTADSDIGGSDTADSDEDIR